MAMLSRRDVGCSAESDFERETGAVVVVVVVVVGVVLVIVVVVVVAG